MVEAYLPLQSLATLCRVDWIRYDIYSETLYRRDGSSALLWAAAHGNEATVTLSLQYGADINTRNPDRRSPLLLAAESGHQSVIKLLLEKEGLDVFLQDKNWETALSMASRNGHGIVVDQLLARYPSDPIDYGGKINYTEQVGKALVNAVTAGHARIVEKLFATDLVDKGMEGFQLLCSAAEEGNEGIAKLLLKAEVSPNAYNVQGRPALFLATEQEHTRIMKLLLEAGADVNCKDVDGRTPLVRAAIVGYEEGVALLLATDGINLNAKWVGGGTALSFALMGKHTAIVKWLCAAGGATI